MSIAVTTGLFVAALIVGLFTGLPVAFVLIGVSMLFLVLVSGPATAFTSALVFYKTMSTDLYIAMPLFCFMAFVLEFSGIATAIYDTMYKWFGGLRGGLAMGTVATCTVLAATTGLGATGVILMGTIALPEMLKRGYSKEMAVGCIPFGGSLGPLIPPSGLMIILGGFASISIGKLFIGGVFPGLLMAALAIVYIGIKCYRNPTEGPALGPEERASWGEKFRSLRGVIAPVILVFAVIGTIYSGICTPSEAGGIGSLGTLIIALINRKLTLPRLYQAGINTIKVTAMVMWLLTGGALFSVLLSATGAGHFISNLISGLPVSSMSVLVLMMLIGLVLGCFMDGAAITMITIPVFMPIVYQLNLDPLWFGLLFTMNMIIGYITPPFGMNLFYMKAFVPKNITMLNIYRSVLPYIIIQIVVLVLCIVFPQITLWLPNMMLK